MSHGNRLNEYQKVKILEGISNKRTQEDIANEFGCAASTISRLKRKFDKTGEISNKKPVGRSKSYSSQDVLDVKNTFLRNDCITAEDVKKKYKELYQRDTSVDTIRRIMKEGGLSFKNKYKKQDLTEENAEKRLAFAKKFVSKDINFWKKVIFADETIIKHGELQPTKGWMLNKEPVPSKRSVKQIKQGGGFKINIWSCLTYYGPGYIVNLPDGLDGVTYTEILEHDLEETLKDYKIALNSDWILAQDNSPVHMAHVVKHHMEDKGIEKLDWPPYSPDINIIENAWSYLKLGLIEEKKVI